MPQRLSQPRVAEMVADVLRGRIVDGELADGDLLPKQDDLLQEFGVSRPSIREAMRILETEGLISVRRGNIGGSEVHRPKPQAAAYMLGLVLQSRKVVLSDLAAALRTLEPACAGLCARLPGRRRIATHLRAINDQAQEHLDNGPEFTRVSRDFHDSLASSCENETMAQLVGTLETLWSYHEARWADEITQQGAYPEPDLRKMVIAAHSAIASAIGSGDAEAAEKATRTHLEQAQQYLLANAGNQKLAITQLRVGLGPRS
jgi:GntR family transcriptional regulator, transcriptional repressor for pyruvate dehydrogenase complex